MSAQIKRRRSFPRHCPVKLFRINTSKSEHPTKMRVLNERSEEASLHPKLFRINTYEKPGAGWSNFRVTTPLFDSRLCISPRLPSRQSSPRTNYSSVGMGSPSPHLLPLAPLFHPFHTGASATPVDSMGYFTVSITPRVGQHAIPNQGPDGVSLPHYLLTSLRPGKKRAEARNCLGGAAVRIGRPQPSAHPICRLRLPQPVRENPRAGESICRASDGELTR